MVGGEGVEFLREGAHLPVERLAHLRDRIRRAVHEKRLARHEVQELRVQERLGLWVVFRAIHHVSLCDLAHSEDDRVDLGLTPVALEDELVETVHHVAVHLVALVKAVLERVERLGEIALGVYCRLDRVLRGIACDFRASELVERRKHSRRHLRERRDVVGLLLRDDAKLLERLAHGPSLLRGILRDRPLGRVQEQHVKLLQDAPALVLLRRKLLLHRLDIGVDDVVVGTILDFVGAIHGRGVLDFWTIVQVDLVKSHYGINSAHWPPSFFSRFYLRFHPVYTQPGKRLHTFAYPTIFPGFWHILPNF